MCYARNERSLCNRYEGTKKKRVNLVAGLGACVCASREVKGRSNIHTRTYVDELEISKSEKGNFEWEVIGLTARHGTADERRGQ